MTDPRTTVLVALANLPAAAAGASFGARFPGVDLLHVPYRLPDGLQTARVADPVGSAAAEPVLTAEQIDAFRRADVLLTIDAPRDLPALAPRLRWVQSGMSGVTSFAVCGITGSAITLTNTAGLTAGSIAEWVLGRILAVYKRFDEHAAQQREHVWRPAFGDDVAGRTVLVVGLGAIGAATARLCHALGMTVVGVRRTPCPPGAEPEGVSAVRHPAQLHALAARADVVVGCLPAGDATADVFGADLFAAMPAGSVFINVGRGTSVDEKALVAALESGHLRAAAVDVARQEPLPAVSPLWDAPRLAISPHSSATISGYMDRVWELFAANLEAYLAGRPLRGVVRPEDLTATG